MKIDFFVGGAPKSGTSTIYDIMRQHSEISCPIIKEGHFFSLPEVKNTYYEVKFIESVKDFESNFHDSDNADMKFGDFSPSYLRYENSMERIKACNPDVKAIFILRDPIDRMISHYQMDKSLGYVNQSLDKIVFSEEETLFKSEYLDNSYYTSGVKNAIKIFGSSNVLLVSFEEFKDDSVGVVNSILSFIGISELKDFEKVHSNKTKADKYKIRFLVRKLKLSGLIKFFIPEFIKEKVKNVVLSDEVEVINRDQFIPLFLSEYEYFKLEYPEISKFWKC
jgi:hypothetical protein